MKTAGFSMRAINSVIGDPIGDFSADASAIRKSGIHHLWMPIVLIASVSCTSGPCRQLRQPELAGQEGAAVVTDKNKAPRVFVSKADGSLQCNVAPGVTAKTMEKTELSGIEVFSRDNRPDGLMHIQLCGSPTGRINVFEIPASSLAEAEQRGFKKLEEKAESDSRPSRKSSPRR